MAKNIEEMQNREIRKSLPEGIKDFLYDYEKNKNEMFKAFELVRDAFEAMLTTRFVKSVALLVNTCFVLALLTIKLFCPDGILKNQDSVESFCLINIVFFSSVFIINFFKHIKAMKIMDKAYDVQKEKISSYINYLQENLREISNSLNQNDISIGYYCLFDNKNGKTRKYDTSVEFASSEDLEEVKSLLVLNTEDFHKKANVPFDDFSAKCNKMFFMDEYIEALYKIYADRKNCE